MALIEFKDFPNTETPIDSENLNHNFNELDNATKNGWNRLKTTFTFVSWDSTTYTGVVSTNIDLTAYLTAGMKIKLTQNSAVKYAFITAITSTQITLFMGTDYTLTNNTISDVFYSMLKAPFGFPTDIEKWQISASVNNQGSMFTVSARTAKTMLSIELPTGLWNIESIGWVNWRTNSPGTVFDGNYSFALQQDVQASPASGGFNRITYVADTSNNPGGDFRSNVSTSLSGYKVTNKQTIYGNAYQYSPNAQYQLFGEIKLAATIAYL